MNIDERWFGMRIKGQAEPVEQDSMTLPNGDVLRFHPQKQCAGGTCCLHNPSDHHMKEWPLNWRDDRGLMERICEHGVGHPDPDGLAHIVAVHGQKAADVEAVHGCDLCC